MSSCESCRHSTNSMVPFSRAPLNLAIAHFFAMLSKFWRSWKSFFPRARGGRGRALIGHVVQLPRTSLLSLDWSDSAHSPYQARLPTDPPFVLTVQNPRFPAPLSPPRSSLSPPLPPAPLLLKLPLRLVEFLSLSLEGPLPPLGLPTNCPLHPLFSLS